MAWMHLCCTFGEGQGAVMVVACLFADTGWQVVLCMVGRTSRTKVHAFVPHMTAGP
jgi:hypothetical protein